MYGRNVTVPGPSRLTPAILTILLLISTGKCTMLTEPSPGGDWEAYWNEFCTHADFQEGASRESCNPSSREIMQVPGTWRDLAAGLPINYAATGYVTLRRTISPELPGEDLVLYIPRVVSAYEFDCDSTRILTLGRIGRDARMNIPQIMPRAISLPPECATAESFIWRISNFHTISGGPRETPYIMTAANYNRFRFLYDLLNLSMMGGVFFLGVYHLLVWTMVPIERHYLFFGLLAACAFAHHASMEAILSRVAPELPLFAFESGMHLISVYSGLGFFLAFLRSLFPRETNRYVSRIFYALFVAAVGMVLLLPLEISPWLDYGWLSLAALAYGFGILILAVARRRRNAITLSLGAFLGGGMAVHDVLFTFGLHHGPVVAKYGFAVFGICQVMALARLDRYAEEVANRLRSRLEREVQRKSAELSSVRRKLQESFTERGRFFRSVSNDLRSPLTLIQGITALAAREQRDLTPEDQDQVLRETIRLQRISDDSLRSEERRPAGPTLAPGFATVPEPKTPPRSGTVGRHRILVVEDEFAMRSFLRQFLESEGYLVSEAASGAEALQVLDRRSVDLVITDLYMPLMSGAELIQRLRSKARQSSLPVLLLSAWADEVTRETIYSVGASAYLSKPFDGRELANVCGNLIVLQERARQVSRDMRKARQMRQALLPESTQEEAPFRFAVRREESEEIGGDLYDCVRLPDGRHYIYMADAGGMGIPVAFLSASLKMLFQVLYPRAMPPGRMLERMNVALQDHLNWNFVACCVALVAADGRSLDYASAGHPGLLLLRDGRLERHQTHGPPPGAASPDAPYAEDRLELRADDRIFMHSHGFLQTPNQQGQRYPVERLENRILESGRDSMPLDTSLEYLLDDVRNWRGRDAIHRELTIVGFEPREAH